MEVRGENDVLRNSSLLNRAATAIDNSSSENHEKQQAARVGGIAAGEKSELDDESVLLSISAAGLRRSLLLERQAANEESETFSGETELEDMMKKMEGLSSQVINGHFSISDRLNFNSEIHKLANELNRLNSDSVTVTKENCYQLSQRISDLIRVVNDAAVYRNSARTVFMVNSKQPEKTMRTKLDIAI